MKRITILPKYVFDDRYTDAKIEELKDSCFISILDPNNNENKHNPKCNNFLQVKFWDIEDDYFDINGNIKYPKPPDSQLTQIVGFVNKNCDASEFIIHCSAGISRSGAVGEYIKALLYSEVDIAHYNWINRNIQPNLYIKGRLFELELPF